MISIAPLLADIADEQGRAAETPAVRGFESDPLIAALARYVEALHVRHPDGPDEIRLEGLDARAKVCRMRIMKDPAA